MGNNITKPIKCQEKFNIFLIIVNILHEIINTMASYSTILKHIIFLPISFKKYEPI